MTICDNKVNDYNDDDDLDDSCGDDGCDEHHVVTFVVAIALRMTKEEEIANNVETQREMMREIFDAIHHEGGLALPAQQTSSMPVHAALCETFCQPLP